MTELAGEIIQLALYQTKAIVPVQTLAPGVYTQRMLTQGNSLLSTVFVESLDGGASVATRYYDFTLGGDIGEQVDLAEHVTITTALTSDRITVPRMHDKPIVELTVTGGNVRVGIYVTVVASFATDLDAALKLDQQVADLFKDKGMPMMLYDENVGQFFFLRGEGGAIPITISEAGDPVHLVSADNLVTTPGTQQDLITDSVPSGKVRKLTQAMVVCRHPGTYLITADGDIIGSGRTGPASSRSMFTWNPRKSVPTGTELKVVFTGLAGTPAADIEAYLMGSDV